MIKYHTEAERELCEKRMGWVVKLAGLIMFAPAVFCIIQICNGIFSIWNIFPAVLCFIICLNIYIPGMFGKVLSFITLHAVGAEETTPQSELDREQRELEEDMKKNPEKYKEQERKKGWMSLDGYYCKLKGWDILVRFVLVIGLAVGAYFSINHTLKFEEKNAGCSVVQATVVSQTDKTYYTYEEDEDGTTETEHRSCEAVLKYSFNGETIEKTVTFQNVAKIKVIKFDIYVDAAGNFLQTTAKVQGFFILGVTLAIMAFLMFASIVLKFSPIFYIMIVFFAIGPVILSLVGSTVSFAELLYFDLTTFIMVFSSVGVYFMLAQFFGRFLLVGHATISEPEKKEKRRNKNAQQELYNLMSTDDRNDTDVHPEDNY